MVIRKYWKNFWKKGMDITQTEAKGLDVFIFASAYGHLEIVKFLIEKGADINKVDNNGSKRIDTYYCRRSSRNSKILDRKRC